MLRKYGWILLMAAFAVVYWLGQPSANHPRETIASAPVVLRSTAQVPATATPLPENATTSGSANLPDFLPPEAKTTLDLIARQGPFPHRQDGVVFQNREKRLPRKDRGYYHEYTVDTPGLDHRGTRRIITGGSPVEVYYYTDDHYQSFREFEIRP